MCSRNGANNKKRRRSYLLFAELPGDVVLAFGKDISVDRAIGGDSIASNNLKRHVVESQSCWAMMA